MSLASSQGCQPTASRVMVQIILKNLELCIHYFIKKFQVYDNDDDTISIITTPSMAQWCQTTASGVVSIFLKISSVRNDADNVMMQNYGIRSHVSLDYFKNKIKKQSTCGNPASMSLSCMFWLKQFWKQYFSGFQCILVLIICGGHHVPETRMPGT